MLKRIKERLIFMKKRLLLEKQKLLYFEEDLYNYSTVINYTDLEKYLNSCHQYANYALMICEHFEVKTDTLKEIKILQQ